MLTDHRGRRDWTYISESGPVHHGEDSDHFEGPLENTRKKENVVWILMAALAVVTVAAFRLLWLKADG
jgi:hypothetical protein